MESTVPVVQGRPDPVRVIGDGNMARFSVDVKMANSIDVVDAERGLIPPEQVRRVTIRSVVDSGATRLVIPETVVKQLGVREAGPVQVRYADGCTATRKLVEDVQLEVVGRQGTFRATVEPGRTTALIGAFVLEELDLLVDTTVGALLPRDPHHIISEIE